MASSSPSLHLIIKPSFIHDLRDPEDHYRFFAYSEAKYNYHYSVLPVDIF